MTSSNPSTGPLNFARFRSATLAGLPAASLLETCRCCLRLADAPQAEAAAEAQAIADTPSQAEALLRALPLVREHLRRAQALAPHHVTALAPHHVTALAPHHVTALVPHRMAALAAVGDAVRSRWPGLDPFASAPPADQAAALAAHVDRLQQAMQAVPVGLATPERVRALADAVALFESAGQALGAVVARDHGWWSGHALAQRARAETELGDASAALASLRAAAAAFTRQGFDDQAADCNRRARALEGGFDATLTDRLDVLLRSQRTEAPERAVALAGQALATLRAGDRYDADRLAREAAALLVAGGYADPAAAGIADATEAVEAVMGLWLDAACGSGPQGDQVLGRLAGIANTWIEVLGVRANVRLNFGPSRGAAVADRMLSLIHAIGAMVGRLLDEAAAARADLEASLAHWFAASEPALPGATAQTPAQPASSVETQAQPGATNDAPAQPEATAVLAAAQASLDGRRAGHNALYQVRLQCERHPARSQVRAALDVRRRADAACDPELAVAACLEAARVLLRLRQPGRAGWLAHAALARLFERPEAGSLNTLATEAQRTQYLLAMEYHLRALHAQRRFTDLLALAAPLIDALEARRATVSSDFAHAAFLGDALPIYELAIHAAWRAEDVDRLLALSDLLKSRGALRRALAGPDDAEASALAERLGERDTMIRDLDAAAPAELIDERRWLIEALALARGRRARAHALPAPTVAALRARLAADEVLMTWVMLGSDALVTAISHTRVVTVPLQLGEAGLATLQDWTQGLAALALHESALPATDLSLRLEALVQAIWPPALVEALGDVLDDGARLVVCPHRVLHLVPFHALPRRGRPLVETHACRYVPSLGSLLLPWTGNSVGEVMAVGVSHFADGSPALDQAALEAREIAAVHGPAGRALIDVGRAALLREPLGQLRCLHLATHAGSVLAGDALDDPRRCGITLADGVLDGFALAELDLPAELVVVAACHAGQRAVFGRGLAQLPGDDLFGLPAALFAAGARHVLGALWPVDDAVARRVMVAFHHGYAEGLPPETALQRALNGLRAQASGGGPDTPPSQAPGSGPEAPLVQAPGSGPDPSLSLAAGSWQDASLYMSAYFWAPFYLASFGSPGGAPADLPTVESNR